MNVTRTLHKQALQCKFPRIYINQVVILKAEQTVGILTKFCTRLLMYFSLVSDIKQKMGYGSKTESEALSTV